MRNRFHSLCPYFAMFPESFAETWIANLTSKGDVILDPFSGRGTTAFQALLMNRRAVACDINDVAFCLTSAKTSSPSLSSLKVRLTKLESEYDSAAWLRLAASQPEFFSYAFASSTLAQLLYLRSRLKWKSSRTDAMLSALALGILHGDKSPIYLSNRMPRTISTKPAYSVRFWVARQLLAPERDVFENLRKIAAYRYVSPPPTGEATILHTDMRRLPWHGHKLPSNIRCVITSPPYFDVTSFEEDQWLRLWFLGGAAQPTYGRISRDDRYSFEPSYWAFIADMWRSLGSVLSRDADIVLRIGSGRVSPKRLSQMLAATSCLAKRRVNLISSSVSEIKRRQTDSFRPGSRGCRVEVDCHFQMH